MKPKQSRGGRRSPASRSSRPGAPRNAGRSRRLTFVALLLVAGVSAGLTISYFRTRSKPSAPPRSESPALASSTALKTQVVPPAGESGDSVSLEPPPPMVDTNDPVQILNLGTRLLESGKIEEAIVEYQRAAALKPDDEEAQFNLGLAHTRLAKLAAGAGQSAEASRLASLAERYYNEALRLFPDYPEAHKNLGNLLMEVRRYDEAMAHFSAAIRLSPDNSSIINSLGKCLALQGKTREALAQFQEAVRLNADSIEARFNLASACAQLGQIDEAIREFEQVVKIAPDLEVAVRRLAELKAKKAAGP